MKTIDIIDSANGGIIGIDEYLNIFGGYNEQFKTAGARAERPEWIDAEDWDEMPKEEKHALADRMIALWQQYKNSAY